MSRVIRAVIMGPPGAGKGTISRLIVDHFHLKHISSGDILRDHVSKKTPLGLEAQHHIKSGGLVPDETVIQLMCSGLQSLGNVSWLLDGFPRTVQQARALSSQEELHAVINLSVPADTIISRVKQRWIHQASGRVYNLGYNPPLVQGKDDITGEDLVQREDDKPETVARRLATYEKQTAPLLDYYSSLDGNTLRTFSGTESKKIWPDVKKFIEMDLL